MPVRPLNGPLTLIASSRSFSVISATADSVFLCFTASHSQAHHQRYDKLFLTEYGFQLQSNIVIYLQQSICNRKGRGGKNMSRALDSKSAIVITLTTIVKRDLTALGKIHCSTLTKPTVVFREVNTIKIASTEALTKIGIRLRKPWGLESCMVSDTIGVSGLYYSGVVSTPDSTVRSSRQVRHWSW